MNLDEVRKKRLERLQELAEREKQQASLNKAASNEDSVKQGSDSSSPSASKPQPASASVASAPAVAAPPQTSGTIASKNKNTVLNPQVPKNVQPKPAAGAKLNSLASQGSQGSQANKTSGVQPQQKVTKPVPTEAAIAYDPNTSQIVFKALDLSYLDKQCFDAEVFEDYASFLTMEYFHRRSQSGRAGNPQLYAMKAYDRLTQAQKQISQETKRIDEIKKYLLEFARVNLQGCLIETWDEDEEPLLFGDTLVSEVIANGVNSVSLPYITQAIKQFLVLSTESEITSSVVFFKAINTAMINRMPTFGTKGSLQYWSLALHLFKSPVYAEFATSFFPADFRKESLNPNHLAQDFFVGKMFSTGPIQGGMIAMYPFDSLKRASVEEISHYYKTSEQSVQLFKSYQRQIVVKIFEASKTSRAYLFNWLTAVLVVNQRQQAENRHVLNLNKLEFMFNIYDVLQQLCHPFAKLDSSMYKYFQRIDPMYHYTHLGQYIRGDISLFDVPDEEKPKEENQNPQSFISTLFFVTLGFMELGLVPVITGIEGKFDEQLRAAESLLGNVHNDPMFKQWPVEKQKRYLATVDQKLVEGKLEKAGFTFFINAKEFMEDNMRVCTFMVCFAMNLAQNFPGKLELVVPWNKEVPLEYRLYPSYCLSAPVISMTHFGRDAVILTNNSRVDDNELIINFCMFFISSPEVLNQPYIRMKIARLLHFGVLDLRANSGPLFPGSYNTNFATSENCKKYLIPAIMILGIAMVRDYPTMSYNDKVQVKKYIYLVFKKLFENRYYVDSLQAVAKERPELCIKFAGCLVDDLSAYLEGGLNAVRKIHTLEEAIMQKRNSNSTISSGAGTPNVSANSAAVDPTAAAAQALAVPQIPNVPNVAELNSQNPADDDQAVPAPAPIESNESDDLSNELRGEMQELSIDPSSDRQQLIKLVGEQKGMALAYWMIFYETMIPTETFTEHLPQIFGSDEILHRCAIMLNSKLAVLVGPQCSKLKIKDGSSVKFVAKNVLRAVLTIFLNLRNVPGFPRALARDERSYSDKLYNSCIFYCKKGSILSENELIEFETLIKKVKIAHAEAEEEDMAFDDVPDEYLDPLMYEIMENPVTLPVSKMNIDLTTIKEHLLTDATDPFNRVPLKIEDVVPNLELKKEIEEFKRRKRQEIKEKEAQMDVD